MTDNTNNIEMKISEVVDIEEYAKAGKNPPKAKKYKIKVDKNKYEVTVSAMTGREILVLAKLTPPERFMISQMLHGGEVVEIGLSETIDFTTPGIEKFMTIPLDQTDG